MGKEKEAWLAERLRRIRHAVGVAITPMETFFQFTEVPKNNPQLAQLRKACQEAIGDLRAALKWVGERERVFDLDEVIEENKKREEEEKKKKSS